MTRLQPPRDHCLPCQPSAKGAVPPVVKTAADARASSASKSEHRISKTAVASLMTTPSALGLWVSVPNLFLDPYLESK